MISSLGFTFVILPCIAACAMAALIRDWRLAAAAFFGGLSLIFAAPFVPLGYGLIGLPVFTGVAIGGLVTTATLLRRPVLDIWGRMLPALMVCFTITFFYLLFATRGA